MPRAIRKAVAPVNPEPKWPAGYFEVLREAGAKEVTIPHCVAWVRRFFAKNSGRRRRDLGRKEIETYLVRPCGKNANWQVQQARDALELYYEQFRGIPLEPRPDLSTQVVPLSQPHPLHKPDATFAPPSPKTPIDYGRQTVRNKQNVSPGAQADTAPPISYPVRSIGRRWISECGSFYVLSIIPTARSRPMWRGSGGHGWRKPSVLNAERILLRGCGHSR